ncbi:serine hydrolase domain-containing protein [Yinghuangia aomiensis]
MARATPPDTPRSRSARRPAPWPRPPPTWSEAPSTASALPGALVAVAAHGKVAYAATGHARRSPDGAAAPHEPMGWDTRTDAGSVTKIPGHHRRPHGLGEPRPPGVDDPAARYLPGPDPAIRLRDLLEHRAGLREWWPLYLDGPGGPEAAARAARIPRRYAVGAGRHYSDLGFILLGEVVGRIGGGLERSVAELVMTPYGLTATGYRAPVPGGPVAASSAGDWVERRMIATAPCTRSRTPSRRRPTPSRLARARRGRRGQRRQRLPRLPGRGRARRPVHHGRRPAALRHRAVRQPGPGGARSASVTAAAFTAREPTPAKPSASGSGTARGDAHSATPASPAWRWRPFRTGTPPSS